MRIKELYKIQCRIVYPKIHTRSYAKLKLKQNKEHNYPSYRSDLRHRLKSEN